MSVIRTSTKAYSLVTKKASDLQKIYERNVSLGEALDVLLGIRNVQSNTASSQDAREELTSSEEQSL